MRPQVTSATGNVSREHQIFDGPGRMIGVVGGKLTNYRIMANQVMERVLELFPQLAGVDARVSRTKRIMLGGWLDKQDFLTTTAQISTRARKLLINQPRLNLIASYGKDTQSILTLLNRLIPEPDASALIISHRSWRNSSLRRQRKWPYSGRLAHAPNPSLAQLHHRQCLEAAPKVTRIMQQLLGWDDTRVAARAIVLAIFGGQPAGSKMQLYTESLV